METNARLAPQLHDSIMRPDPSFFQPVKNDGIKPKGGLWTSTHDPPWGSDWIQWCLSNEFRIRKGDAVHCWRLTPKPDAFIYHIDTYADLKHLVYFYPFWPYHGSAPRLDFERIASKYDAIHLTEWGQWATRLSYPYDLYGWDCESTLWLRWAFNDVEDLGECVFPVRE